ncbi:TPA: glycerol-3-phosphate responsive antiterminator, partial [Klebsiella pneumoniae subsp. pneumoniae]|nr:glycerol-3-phosphate responsive antiterminator [Klebsiella pneumoniae subsp. pneumoniae]
GRSHEILFIQQSHVVFIAGGFVKRKYLVDKIFHAGFKGITTSEPGLW